LAGLGSAGLALLSSIGFIVGNNSKTP